MHGGSQAGILVADDERAVRSALADAIGKDGYSVVQARDGVEAVRLFASERPALVLLDVMMPRMDGFAACRKIRETDARVPVLFLTALDDDASQLKGLGLGADDYVAKSAPVSVLLARIAAALRRSLPQEPSGDFDFGGWRVVVSRMEMRRRGGERRLLGEREIALMRLFAESPGDVFCRDHLMSRLWGVDADISDGLLSVLVHKLRAKLGGDGRLIRSIRGAGYMYDVSR